MQTEKAQRVQQLTDEALTSLSESLKAGKSETLKRYLAAIAKFHRYSFGNQMLIAFQKPDATHVAGFNAWKKLGRYVKKGEKGILIVAPVVRKSASDEKAKESEQLEDAATLRVVNFTTAYVFDISQTEGEPLPEFSAVSGDPAAHLLRLKALVEQKGITLNYAEHLGGAFGLSHGGKISILKGMAPASEFSVLTHELAHELLHRDGEKLSRKVVETEAEAVAFVVSQGIGLEAGTAASDYILLYTGDTDTLSESLERIRKTACEILTFLLPQG
jgi:hypothetical protein